jgi:flagellar biosynthesis protein FlhG
MTSLRVISVTSGKGGVGKTHLAANVATLCAKAGLRTLAIDADAGLANLDLVLGVQPGRHVGHLLDGAALDEVLVKATSGLSLLPASPGERRLVHLAPADRRALVTAWDSLASNFEVVVVDSGPGVGDDTLFFAAIGQQVVLLVTEEPTSIADAFVLLKALREKTAVRAVDIVVNGVRTIRSAQAVFARLCSCVEHLGITLRFLAHVPDDQNLRRAAMLRRPLVELAPTSPASRAFERITQALLEAERIVPAGVTIGAEHQLDEPLRGRHALRSLDSQWNEAFPTRTSKVPSP